MEKIDFRKLSMGEQEGLRRRGIYLVKEEGKTKASTARILGVSRQTVSEWCKKYEENGKSSITDKRRISHRKGECLLEKHEIKKLQNWINDKCPDQFKLDFALWSARAVQCLIEEKFGKTISYSSVKRYLRSWGYTPQVPAKRAYEQQPEKVKKWLEEDYPMIAKQAKVENATILWGDETCIQNHCQVARSYSPKGKTPVLERHAKKYKSSMISAISNKGEMQFMLYDGGMNAWTFIKFIKQLIRQYKGKKVVLIVDNLRVHHAKIVRKFVMHKKIIDRIQIEYLPPYTPQHNPDEYLNNDLKQQLKQKTPPKNKEQLISKTTDTLVKIKNDRNRVASYFNPDYVKYAA